MRGFFKSVNMSVDKFDVRAEFEALHKSYPSWEKRPVVGITANFRDGNAALAEAYYTSVLEAGATPLIIPPYTCREALLETLEHIDALLLTGGADIDPRYMNEEPDYSLLHSINPKRDEQEILLTLLAEARIDAADTLFIDDAPENCEAARAVGIHAHLVERNSPWNEKISLQWR